MNKQILLSTIVIILLSISLALSEDMAGGSAIEDTGGDTTGINPSKGVETITKGDTQTPKTFNLNQVNTWYKDWNKIKSQLQTSKEDINTKWTKASEEDRNTCLNNLINAKNQNIKVTNLGSSSLSLTEEGKLTNGNTYLNPEKLPKNLESLEYNGEKKGFVYTFKDNKVMTMRTGTLIEDYFERLIISGTGWPSEGLVWNGKGKFIQSATGVNLEGDSKVQVSNIEAQVADKNQLASVSFLEGVQGNKYVKGKNLDVLIKHSKGLGSVVEDYARVKIPVDIETEVFVGDEIKPSGKQYVKLSEDGQEIKIEGKNIDAELLKSLTKVEADGENILVRNKEMKFRFNGDKTEINKPAEGFEGIYTNLLNPDAEIKVTEIEEPAKEKEDLKIATETKISDTKTTTTTSGNKRVTYVKVGEGITSTSWGMDTSRSQFSLGDEFNNLPKELTKEQFYAQVVNMPKQAEITTLLRVRNINKNDILTKFIGSAQEFEKMPNTRFTSKDTANLNALLNTPGVLMDEYPRGSRIVISSGNQNNPPTIGSFTVTNQAQTESLRNFFNHQIVESKDSVPGGSFFNNWYNIYQNR